MHYSTPRVYLPRPDRLYHNLMSRQWRPETDLTTIREVLSKYDLDLLKDPRALSGGNRSHSLLVYTSRGKKVLKKYEQNLGQSTIVQEHSILTYLAQIDFPSPRLVASSAGETLVRRGEHRYALFDFIEGGFQYHHYFLLLGQARKFITMAGEMLALLHSTLEGFVPQGYNPDGFKSQHEDRWRNLEWVLGKLAHCVAETSHLKTGADKGQAAWLSQQASYLEKSLVQLDAVLREAALPRLIIHSDYGPYNLLFRKDAPPVVLDFEMARLDWRVTELIQAWYRFSYDKLGFRLNKMKWLLNAYQTHFPLTEGELQLVPAVWKYINVWQCAMNWYRYCETRADSYLAGARRNLKMVDWMIANQDNLIQF